MPFSPAVLGHQMPSVSGQYRKALTADDDTDNIAKKEILHQIILARISK